MDGDEPHTEYVGVLVDPARRARLRRRTALAVLAVGVVASILATGHDAPSSPTSRVPPTTRAPATGSVANGIDALPRGAAPSRAYVVGRTLHLPGGEAVLEGTPQVLLEAGSSVIVQYRSRKIVRVDLSSGAATVLAASAAGPPAIDAGGRYVAWQADGAGPATVVLHPLDGGSERRQRFPATPVCCDDPFYVEGITGAGQLVAALPSESKAWVWQIGGRGSSYPVTDVRHLAGFITQVTANALVARPLDSGLYVAGTLTGGTFEETDRIEAGRADFGDPSGRRVAYLDDTGAVHVRDRRPGVSGPGILYRDTEMRVPGLTGTPLISWEDADHVLVDTSGTGPSGWLLRCDVSTGACARSLRFAGPHLVAP